MKLIKWFISLFIDTSTSKSKTVSTLECEKHSALFMLFPF